MEVVEIPKEDLAELHKEMARLHEVATEALDAKEAYQSAWEELLAAAKRKVKDAQLEARIKAKLDAAAEKMKKAEAKQRAEIKAIGPKLDSDKERLMELIPIQRMIYKNEKGQTHKFENGAMFTYVRSHKRRQHWRRYKMDHTAEGQSQSASFLVKDEKGRTRIDHERLKSQLTKLKVEGKAHAFWEKHKSGLVNDALKWSATLNGDDKSRHIDLSASAQLMRWGLGASAYRSGLGDLRKGKIAARVNGRAEFALAEGKASGAFYFPNVGGWMLKYTWTDPKGSGTHTFDMGAVRLGVELNLSGTVGVSLVVEAGLEINLKEEKVQKLKGAPAQIGDDLAPSMDVSTGQVKTRGKRNAEIKTELEAFAGAKASAELVGALQWQKPESTDFENFVKIGPTVDGRAGIGAGLYLDIEYVGGKFLFKAQASLCVGLGAKGKLVLEADAHLVKEFALWFYHQLRHCDYRMLTHMKEQAFIALCHLHYLAIAKGVELGKSALDAPRFLADQIESWIESKAQRLTTAANLIAHPERLLAAPPETQGLILFHLTDEGFWGHLVSDKWELDLRRQAAMQVLRCLKTRRHCENLLQHLTPDVGEKVDRMKAEDQLWAFFAAPWEQAEALVAGRRAPRTHQKNSDRQRTWGEQFIRLVDRLPVDAAVGWQLAFNDEFKFRMQEGVHPTFSLMARFAEGGDTVQA